MQVQMTNLYYWIVRGKHYYSSGEMLWWYHRRAGQTAHFNLYRDDAWIYACKEWCWMHRN